MGKARKVFGGIGRRALTKVMDRVGGRLVSGMADTSADAPSAFHQPKRDLYRHMKDGKLAAPPQAVGPDEAPADADKPADHDHDHDHDHGR